MNFTDLTLPFVSICTPTFNRRPFIPQMIKCFNHQTYPKSHIEWIIIDDGTDKIEDLVKDIKEVKYFKYDEKLSLGKKRNISHSKTNGEIIIYFDDDDYYPPERISHAVEQLVNNPDKLCAGSSIMHIYFKHINRMFKFGPYGDNHATAATFAFKRELLSQTAFNNENCLAEERLFLKNWTIPMIQLNSLKTILVFSHNQNTFDKKQLLLQNIHNNPYINPSDLKPNDFIQDPQIIDFFMNNIDNLLERYEPGNATYKPDVLKEMDKLNKKRNELNQHNNSLNEMTLLVQELKLENNNLKDKLIYLEIKIRELIQKQIDEKNK
jgi:glycosyltransferase involved in cell wall biosynthesis